MPDRKVGCDTLSEFSYTGAALCPFLGEQCKGNQPKDNCLLWDKLDHDQALSRKEDWSETDEPIAF